LFLADILISRGRAIAFVCGLMIGISAPATFVQALDEPMVGDVALSEFVATDQYDERLITYLVGYETWIGPCPSPEPVERVTTLLTQNSVPLPGEPDLDAPQWIELLRVTGCDVDYERLVFVSLKDGKPLFHAQLMGSTRASPKLEAETIRTLIETEGGPEGASGCPETFPIRVFSAAFDESFQTEYGAGWRESWLLADCNGTREVEVTFTPDHAGSIGIGISAPAAE
jgi:hypothetical protein